MKTIIVEDEYAAAKNLAAILQEIQPDIEILAVLESVSEATEWICSNPAPDLGFFDVQLSDKSVFHVFENCEVKFPVIFTTAYSQYAIKAFKVNSLDYILKPVNKEDVEFALEKYTNLKLQSQEQNEDKIFSMLRDMQKHFPGNYKRSLLVHYKDRLIPIDTQSIAFFSIEEGTVYVYTKDNKKFPISQNLESLEKQLDPALFFRANRQYIVSRNAIKEVNQYFNNKLSLHTQPASKEKIIISKARVPELKTWLEG